MVHHTVRRLYGDNCFFADNSWKRSQRRNTGDTLIFNFGNTCCGGGGYSYEGCCGGGSFWGGFGTGVGMGLANLLSGFMGGFIGYMWGGMPWTSYCGGGSHTQSKPTDDKKTDKTSNEPQVLGQSSNAKDSGNASNNDTAVGQGQGTQESTPANTQGTQQTPQDNVKIQSPTSEEGSGNNPYTVLGLNHEQSQSLQTMGVNVVDLPYTTHQKGLSLPTDMSADNLNKLKDIADAHSIPVAVAYNPQSTIDTWIAGKIENITTDSNGNVSFDIDCNGVGKYGYTYKATHTKGTSYNVQCTTQVLKKGDTAHPNGYPYTLENQRLYRNGNPLITEKNSG